MRRAGFIMAVAVCALFLSVAAWAGDYKEISVTELKKMIDSKAKMGLIDARTAGEFNKGHIPTAINIEPEKVMFIAGFLPKDKNLLLVFYCRGVG